MFLLVEFEPSLPDAGSDSVEVGQMFRPILAEDDHVIQACQTDFSGDARQGNIHESREGGLAITHTKANISLSYSCPELVGKAVLCLSSSFEEICFRSSAVKILDPWGASSVSSVSGRGCASLMVQVLSSR